MTSLLRRVAVYLPAVVLACCIAARAELAIDSFQPGRLVWSGAQPGTTNWIEWAASLTNGSSWRPFTNVVAGSTVMSADVPFAYRVCETPPTNPLPSSYDLRSHGWITPIKSQIGNRPNGNPDPGNSVGICWAMSAMAVFESSLLKQGITTDADAPGSSFSPWHLGNAVGQPPLHYNEPCYVYYGDIIDIPQFVTEPPTVFGYLSPDGTNGWGGGHVFWLLDYLLCWTGPMYEAAAPVPVGEMTAMETLVWTNRDAPAQNYILRGAYRFDPDDYASLTEFRAAAKQAILDYGAIQTYMFVLPADFPDVTAGLTFYDTNNFCIYCPRANLEPMLNHAIAVIGWDDERAVPAAPAPGAWLIKESLGTNVYNKGYHWISYEDQTFLRDDDMFYAAVAASRAGYRWPGLLTHPGAQTRLGMMSTDFLTTGSSMWGEDSQAYAQFNAPVGGELKAIGLVTVNRGEDVTIGIYSNVDAQFNPIQLVASKQVTLDQRGYHLVDLDSPVEIAAGDFYVSVTFAYHDQAEPLVYVRDENLPPARTYLLQYNATNPVPEWIGITDIDPDGSLFLQAVFADP